MFTFLNILHKTKAIFKAKTFLFKQEIKRTFKFLREDRAKMNDYTIQKGDCLWNIAKRSTIQKTAAKLHKLLTN